MRPFLRPTTAIAVALACNAAGAQGIPVIDIANLIQTIQQVLNDVTKIENQVQQIKAMESQLSSITGARNLGAILNNPALQNYVPAKRLHRRQCHRRWRLCRPGRNRQGAARCRHGLQLPESRSGAADELPGLPRAA